MIQIKKARSGRERLARMFGYVRCFPPELRVREYEYYRGVYCGLCRSMGRCCGQLSRCTLSYDVVFLALVRMALTGESPAAKPRRCVIHPLRRRPSCEACPSLDYSARMGALLAYHKLSDDVSDKRGVKSAVARVCAVLMSPARRRAAGGDFGEKDGAIKRHLERTAQLEADDAGGEQLADESGALLGEVFSGGLDGAERRIAYDIGYHVGRWIYYVDAIDDYRSDMENGEYNPFRSEGLPSSDDIRSALRAELAATELALDLIPHEVPSDILEPIRNILYLGSEKTVGEILSGDKKKKGGTTEVVEKRQN